MQVIKGSACTTFLDNYMLPVFRQVVQEALEDCIKKAEVELRNVLAAKAIEFANKVALEVIKEPHLYGNIIEVRAVIGNEPQI